MNGNPQVTVINLNQSTKGITPESNEWKIEYVIPREKGGTNSYSNAQLLSRKENREKLNKLPSELDKLSTITSPTKTKGRKNEAFNIK